MGEFDRQTATASRIISKKGRNCVWRELVGATAADADKPWLRGDSLAEDKVQDNKVKILFLPDTRHNLAFLQTLTDEAINVGDDYGFMAKVDFTPTPRAEIYDETGSTLLRGIKSISPLAPNGEVIFYTLRFTVAK